MRKEDYTREDYEDVPSNHEAHVVVFQQEKGSSEYFMRLWIDYPDNDLLLTWGPMNAGDVDTLFPILRSVYCHIWENWDGPTYESNKGHESEVE